MGKAASHKKAHEKVILLRFFPPESEEWNAVQLLLNQAGQPGRHHLTPTNTNPPGVSWYVEAHGPEAPKSNHHSWPESEVSFWKGLLPSGSHCLEVTSEVSSGTAAGVI